LISFVFHIWLFGNYWMSLTQQGNFINELEAHE